MIVRELERLLVDHGVGLSKMDAVTRRLRVAGALPTGGRGNNAPVIGSREAANILVALAGSGKGNEADVRLAKLSNLRPLDGRMPYRPLLREVSHLLGSMGACSKVSEIRISRTRRYAVITRSDGSGIYYGEIPPPDRFLLEGILPGGLLLKVCEALRSSIPGLVS